MNDWKISYYMSQIPISSALISVYYKDGLEPIVRKLNALGVTIYSTGGTQQFIESLGIKVHAVENLTSYPSILDGRVKTLHPKIFGGILARREPGHLNELEQYDIPTIDLVIVDLYPFEETVAAISDEEFIIEKIDIGGISLIRGAAKNFNDVMVIASMDQYPSFLQILEENSGTTTLEQRKEAALHAFAISSHYDTTIFKYFNKNEQIAAFRSSFRRGQTLRYGENPHQKATFFGNLEDQFELLNGKALSYNNLVDIDAAVGIMAEFKDLEPTFAILKHTNPCGVASRATVLEAWQAALAGDPVSAFGGILISNTAIDETTAKAIDTIFYEVLIAPGFTPESLDILKARKNRILLRIKHFHIEHKAFKWILNGVLEQDSDLSIESKTTWEIMTVKSPSAQEDEDLFFANKCVKHLKSNGIALVKNKQLIGMGCGQTSRVDALNQSIEKARKFGFDLKGSVMASDAFFPFPDCVEIADLAGITAVLQPGGSVKDQESVDYCNEHHMSMVKTGIRHFKH